MYFLDLRLLVLSTSLCNPDLLGRADTADRGHTLGLDIPFTTLGSYVIHSSEVCSVFSKLAAVSVQNCTEILEGKTFRMCVSHGISF